MRITIEGTGGRSDGERLLAAYDSDQLPVDEVGPVHRAAVAIAAVATDGRAGKPDEADEADEADETDETGERGEAGEAGAGPPAYRVTIGERIFELSGELPPELSGPLNILLREGRPR
jgi:hypothetical protein